MGDAMTTILTLYNESGDPMQFGVPLDENSPLFFGCLIAAIGLVYLFCSQKFGERSVVENKDYVYQLTPSTIGDAAGVFKRILDLSIHDGIHCSHSLLDRTQEPALPWSPRRPGH